MKSQLLLRHLFILPLLCHLDSLDIYTVHLHIRLRWYAASYLCICGRLNSLRLGETFSFFLNYFHSLWGFWSVTLPCPREWLLFSARFDLRAYFSDRVAYIIILYIIFWCSCSLLLLLNLIQTCQHIVLYCFFFRIPLWYFGLYYLIFPFFKKKILLVHIKLGLYQCPHIAFRGEMWRYMLSYFLPVVKGWNVLPS